jgi:glycosyltransferase involved in cell wall biosynthesis
MLSGCRIAVVVPAFDEARWIAATVKAMPAFVDVVVVVDDASRDGTAALVEALRVPRVHVVRHPDNRGVGAAIVSGYRHARALGADVIAVMAGDGQMHPDDLPRVLEPIVRGEAEYVKGDRLHHPWVWSAMPLGRIAGDLVLSCITRLTAGLPRLSDAQCGFTAIAAEALDVLDLDQLWPRYGYCNELIARAAAAGLRIAEVVVRPVYRGERSGLRPWHVATYALVLGRAGLRRVTASGKTRRAPPGDPARPTSARRSPAHVTARPPASPDAPLATLA